MVKIAKKFLIVLIMLFTTISFCACSTTRFETTYNDDGSIEQRIYITLNKAELGEEYVDLYSEVMGIAQQQIESERANFLINNLDFSLNDILPIAPTTIDEQNFVVGWWFKNETVYNAFYEINQNNIATYKVKEHFFYKKVYQTGYTMLSHPKLERVYSRIYAQIVSLHPNFAGMEQQNEMRYTMIFDLRREKSNADIVEKKNGKYYHTWIMSDTRQPIEIYFIVANRANWILVCLGVGIVVCGVLCIVGATLVKKRKRKPANESENS